MNVKLGNFIAFSLTNIPDLKIHIDFSALLVNFNVKVSVFKFRVGKSVTKGEKRRSGHIHVVVSSSGRLAVVVKG